MKHAITHKDELLPILAHNRRLAKQEKKILYHLVTKSWQKFDERLQTEMHTQSQVEQVQQDHGRLVKRKIEQERHQALRSKVDEIHSDLVLLQRGLHSVSSICGFWVPQSFLEIQQLHTYKRKCSRLVFLGEMSYRLFRTITRSNPWTHQSTFLSTEATRFSQISHHSRSHARIESSSIGTRLVAHSNWTDQICLVRTSPTSWSYSEQLSH